MERAFWNLLTSEALSAYSFCACCARSRAILARSLAVFSSSLILVMAWFASATLYCTPGTSNAACSASLRDSVTLSLNSATIHYFEPYNQGWLGQRRVKVYLVVIVRNDIFSAVFLKTQREGSMPLVQNEILEKCKKLCLVLINSLVGLCY